jgi:succinyl-diaminopimelate desuccinylase
MNDVSRTPNPGSRTPDLATLTRDLCAIPSVTGDEARIADLVEERCRRVAPEGTVRIGNSVVCHPRRGSPDAPTVALVGHLDTVKPDPDQPVEIRDGRVYGCGASDMKSGVAVMLVMLEDEAVLAGDPVFIFYDREEGPNHENGLEPVLESGEVPALDLAFILEPTDGAVQLGCMGLVHATATVRGRRAHSARPWQGENALHRSVPLLQRVAEFPRREVRFGELTFVEVLNATQAWTENSRNVIPDAAHFNLNLRFAPGRTPAEAEDELRQWVGDLAEIEVIDEGAAGDVHVDHPLLAAWREREGLRFEPKQAWTDVARFTARGIPAVNYGPGETAQAHQAGEWCSVEALHCCHDSLRRFFTD